MSRKQSLPAGMYIFPKTFSPYLSIKLNTLLKNRLVSVFNEENNKTIVGKFQTLKKIPIISEKRKEKDQRPNLTNLNCVQTIPTRDAVQTWLTQLALNWNGLLAVQLL